MHRSIFTLLTSLLAFGAGCLLTFLFLKGAHESTPTTTQASPAAPPIPATNTTSSSPIKPREIAPPVVAKPPPPPTFLPPKPEEAPEIIDILRSQFVDAPALLGTDLNASTLPDVLKTYAATIRIATDSKQTPLPNTKPLIQMLPGGVGYWRPRQLNDAEIARFTTEWSLWKSGDLRGLVIDLRYFRDTNNFDGATAVAGLFVSPQKTLFTIQALNKPQKVYRSERQPLDLPGRFPICVIVNRETRGAGEILAATLREKAGALIVGSPTSGEGGSFLETRLKTGRYLRTATAHAISGEGQDLLGHPLATDIPAYSPEEQKLFFSTYSADPATLLQPVENPPVRRDHSDETPLDGMDESEEENAGKQVDTALQAACDTVRGIASTSRSAAGP